MRCSLQGYDAAGGQCLKETNPGPPCCTVPDLQRDSGQTTTCIAILEPVVNLGYPHTLSSG
jgi:hypothetical protein